MPEHCHPAHRLETTADNQRRLSLVLVITGVYLVAEIVGGFLTNSLALLSDAGHMLTDVGALGLAIFALWFSTRPATPQKTYGYHRLEILVALFNGITLLGISVVIIYEAILRLRNPPEVHGLGLLIVASGGLVVNLAGAHILRHSHAHSLNVRAAFIHLMGDALGSLAAVVAGVLIITLHQTIADPLLAIAIAALIIVSALDLVREAVDILLEATPAHVDAEALRAELLQLSGVVGVHDLHVWTITSELYALSCHVVVEPEVFTTAKLEEIRLLLHDRCEISHQTIQIETADLAAEEDIHL